MPTPPLSAQVMQEALEAFERYGTQRKAAAALGIPRNTFQDRLHRALDSGLAVGGKPRPEFESDPLPDDDLTVEELLAHRKKQFQRKKAHEEARKLIPVRVKLDGPIGIWHFGDPHIDDDGTDIELLEKHSDLIRNTPGLLGANVGDTQNNWTGRLSHLWAQQSISAKQSWKLAEWFIRRVRWLYMIGGNHDCHDSETECLTKRGWLRYDQITDTDEVLSVIPKTGECEWTPILKRIVKPYDGELIDIKTLSVNLSVTPNHRILCKTRDYKRRWRDWEYIEAADIPARIALPASGMANNVGVDLSDDQLALAGWLLTDGSISWDGNSPGVTFYQSKDGSEITRILNALDLKHTLHTRTRNITEVAGRTLVKPPLPQQEWSLTANASRRVLSWVPEKGKLPSWAHHLNGRQFHVLLNALMAGDGCWDGVAPHLKNVGVLHGTYEFLSSVQSVAVQHGWYARISIARGKDARLNLCRRKTIQLETGKAKTKRHYSGTVWCLTVPHGNFMIRRNGAAHFSGNCWSGTGDPLTWIMRGQEMPYADSECRLELQFPNKNTCRINARHDFSGHSQYNPAHGPMKASMFGVRDHINIAGHKHISGKGELIDPDSHIVCHCILVASYKVYDRFQRQKGFRDQRISPGVFTLIKPSLPNNHPDFVRHFWDIEEGIDVLHYLRNKK